MVTVTWKRALLWALHVACALVAAAQIVTLLRIFAARLQYPMDIEWLEGHSLEEAWRVFHAGPPLYGDPALGVQTQIYPPAYFLVVAAVGRVLGLDYWTGRFVSIVAFSTGCAAVALVVAGHAKDRRTGIVLALAAIACVVVAFPVVCAWYDLARVDSLAMGLVLVAAAIATCGTPTPRRSIVVAVVLAVAIFTKQTHLLFAAWIAVFTFVLDRRSGLVMAGVLTGTCALAFAVLEVKSHGWFGWWLTLAAAQDLRPQSLADGEIELVRFAPYLLPLSLVLPFMMGRRWASRTTVFWSGMLAAAFPVGIAPLLKTGGATNNLIPIVFVAPAVAMLGALDYLDGPAFAAPRRDASLGTLLALSCVYIAHHRLSLAPYEPTVDQWAGARAVNHLVASLEGGVIAPSHPFLVHRNAQRTDQILTMGYGELITAKTDVDVRRDLGRTDPRWVILTDPGPDAWMRPAVDEFYALQCKIEPSVGAWATLTSRPRLLYRLRREGSSAGVEASRDVPPCPPHMTGPA